MEGNVKELPENQEENQGKNRVTETKEQKCFKKEDMANWSNAAKRSSKTSTEQCPMDRVT